MLPQWSCDDKLLYLNDKTNWWNLYRLEDDDTEKNLCPRDEEFGNPQWVFGSNDFACIPGKKDVLVHHHDVRILELCIHKILNTLYF